MFLSITNEVVEVNLSMLNFWIETSFVRNEAETFLSFFLKNGQTLNQELTIQNGLVKNITFSGTLSFLFERRGYNALQRISADLDDLEPSYCSIVVNNKNMDNMAIG